jgi:hypothetical protein
MPWNVKLDDGPALNVVAPGRARSLYPLQRLARVVCPAHAEWTTAALMACLRAGVPVVFHDDGGNPLGWCFGPRRRETTLGSLLREAVGMPQGAALIGDWRKAAERREVMAALQACGCNLHNLDAAAARAQLCNRHRLRLGRPVGVYLRALQRSCAALAAERLHEMVGDPELIGFALPGLHLCQTLAALLEWRLHRALHASSARSLTQDSPARFAAQALERHGTGLYRACGELLLDLEHYLRGRLI